MCESYEEINKKIKKSLYRYKKFELERLSNYTLFPLKEYQAEIFPIVLLFNTIEAVF